MADWFSTMFGGGAEAEAADKNRAALANYQGIANNALATGYNTGSQALNSGIGAYQPLVNLGAKYSSGADTLMGALGVGTPEQVAAARSSYSTSPGYDFNMDQTLQALARQRSIGGMGASGNADIDAMTYAHGLANQDYQQWLSNLKDAGNMGITATNAGAAGTSAGYGSLANLATQYGQDQSSVASNVTSGNIASNNMQAAGEAAGAKNLLGAGLSLATLALGGGGAGTMLTSLGNAAGSALIPKGALSGGY